MDINEIFKLYYRSLCLYAAHYLHDIDAAEDVVQECFSTLWENMTDKQKHIDDFKSYLYTMVRNRSLDYLKKESVLNKDISPSDLEDKLTDEEAEDFWNCVDKNGDVSAEVFHSQALLTAFTVLEDCIYAPENSYSKSMTIEHIEAQMLMYETSNKIAMMPTGDWLENEMKKGTMVLCSK